MTRSLNQIAADLRGLAAGQTPGDTALRGLADTLETDSATLTGTDLPATYRPEVLLPDGSAGLRRGTESLELFRDLLIFVPVIYTWWKIAGALEAYTSYTGTDPFLLAWQRGFDGATEPLSRAAVVVAGVVLAVIVLTVLAHTLRGRYEKSVQERRRELSILLAEAGLAINRRIAKAPDVTKAELAAIALQIATSAQDLEKALVQASSEIIAAVDTGPDSMLDLMFQKWTAAADRLTELGTRLSGTQEVVKQLQQTQQALAGMSDRISGETERLVGVLKSERDLSGQEAYAHREIAAEVSEATRQLGDAMKGLNERAEQFNELILRLVFVVNRLDEQTGGAL